MCFGHGRRDAVVAFDVYIGGPRDVSNREAARAAATRRRAANVSRHLQCDTASVATERQRLVWWRVVGLVTVAYGVGVGVNAGSWGEFVAALVFVGLGVVAFVAGPRWPTRAQRSAMRPRDRYRYIAWIEDHPWGYGLIWAVPTTFWALIVEDARPVVSIVMGCALGLVSVWLTRPNGRFRRWLERKAARPPDA
jgi:hypothetical protein